MTRIFLRIPVQIHIFLLTVDFGGKQ